MSPLKSQFRQAGAYDPILFLLAILSARCALIQH